MVNYEWLNYELKALIEELDYDWAVLYFISFKEKNYRQMYLSSTFP